MNRQKRIIVVLAILLLVTIGNFSRNSSSINIRTVDFITIWVIGALSGLLIHKITELFKKAK
jgi:hypothetical protein